MRTLQIFYKGAGLIIFFLAWPLWSEVGTAQTLPITPSGLNTQINISSAPPAGKVQYDITGGVRPGGGTNLFHSFGNFNVPNNNIANFLNETGLPTSNILGRVTGGNISNIIGTIQTTGFGSANLFLMNPAGFLFGPNATVNVGGMVSFASADYLRLADGVRFNAVPNAAADALLTAAPVVAFGFLGSNPGAITVQGSHFTVADGTGISLVGGNITVQSGTLEDGTVQSARLSAPGGQINLASVASPGELVLPTLQPAPNINGQSFTAMGNINLSEGTLLDVSADAAGAVHIRGGQLVIDNATISADTGNTNGAPVAIDMNLSGDLSISSSAVTALTARTTGSGDAGEIRINAQNVNMTATGPEDFTPFAVIDTHTSGLGKAGDVTITATNNVTLSGDPASFVFAIHSGTLGPDGGNGGNVTLNAKNVDVQFANIDTGIGFGVSIFDEPAGSGGNLTISADSVNLTSSILSTDGMFGGRGGNLTISAHDVQLSQFSALSATGFIKGGTIQITADNLKVSESQFESNTNLETGGGIIFNGKVGEFTNGSTVMSSTFGPGTAGPITFTATERLTFADPTDADLAPFRPSGLFTTALAGTGNAAEIRVKTSLLELTGGARLDATTRTTGNGGRIDIVADVVSVSGERPFEILEGGFFGLSVLASGINSRTVQSRFCGAVCGNAGPISITAGSLSLSQGGRIDNSTESAGNGGDITVNANQISITGTTIDGTAGGIFTTASASGTSGNMALNAGQSVTISNRASISASTTGPGDAGNILLKANDITINGGGTITATSTGAGNAGTVTIEGLNSPANSFLVDGAGSGVVTNTEDSGAGGNIFVNANTVTLQNGGTLSAATSGTDVTATGGTITVNANQVQLNSGALITASTTGAGAGGSININTGSTFASNAGTVSSSATQATGGDINIAAGQSVTLENGSLITASSNGEGNAGNIVINAGQQYTSTNSSVTTKAEQASGGNITVLATGLVHLTNSEINASVEGSSTTVGGNILIDPVYVILENSQILAKAKEGQGGNINIFYTGAMLTDSSSLISATSQFGQSGTVTIQSPISPASGKIIPLSQKPLIETSLMSQRCAALAGGNFSSFTLAGRDTLPAEPGGWLSSPLALGTLSENKGLEARSERETPLLSLRQIAPPGFLTQVFAVESSGCQS